MRQMTRRKLLRNGAQAVLAGGVALSGIPSSKAQGSQIRAYGHGLLSEARRDSAYQRGGHLYGPFSFHDARRGTGGDRARGKTTRKSQ
jgi:hypothetical protein